DVLPGRTDHEPDDDEDAECDESPCWRECHGLVTCRCWSNVRARQIRLPLWASRRPHAKARGARIPGVCKRRATQPGGMHGRPEWQGFVDGPLAGPGRLAIQDDVLRGVLGTLRLILRNQVAEQCLQSAQELCTRGGRTPDPAVRDAVFEPSDVGIHV